jgi:hypothetical protein
MKIDLIQRLRRGAFVLALSALLSACASSDVTPLLATDDCGPKPPNPGKIAADWFNSHYSYTPPTPIRPDELSITAPAKVATKDFLLGRKVGWQIILGPENKLLTNFTELNYTRLIINRDWIVSVTSSDQPF